jgi:hypothetical protein
MTVSFLWAVYAYLVGATGYYQTTVEKKEIFTVGRPTVVVDELCSNKTLICLGPW